MITKKQQLDEQYDDNNQSNDSLPQLINDTFNSLNLQQSVSPILITQTNFNSTDESGSMQNILHSSPFYLKKVLNSNEIKNSLDKTNNTNTIEKYRPKSLTKNQQVFKQHSQSEHIQINKFEQKYEILKKIGEGGHAIVYLVKNKLTEELFAAKKIFADNEEIKLIIEEEFKILQVLDHENIVKVEEFIYDEENKFCVIIEEFFDGSSLYEILSQKQDIRHVFDSDEIINIMKQLMISIQYLHEKNVVHKDITIMNVLYNNKTQKIKLIDFGIAKNYAQKDNNNEYNLILSPISNKIFCPAEIISESDEKIDEFQAGVLLFSLIKNKIIPYSYIKKNVLKNQAQINSQQKNQNLYTLALEMIQVSNENRISATQCLVNLSYFSDQIKQ